MAEKDPDPIEPEDFRSPPNDEPEAKKKKGKEK